MSSDARLIDGLTYAEVDGHELKLDLLLPPGAPRAPLVMYIHGGGWQTFDRTHNRAAFLAERGFAIASIDYRLSDEAVFPAQIHDCKAALRWLRAHAGEYGLDGERIVVAGGSAGAHLAVLLACTPGHDGLEGELGAHCDQSTAVLGVVNWFGPMDLPLRGETNPTRHCVPESGSYRLLGGDIGGALERLASPATHVDERSPPLLTLHGLADEQVLPIQATRIAERYAQHRRCCELHLVADAVHGDQRLFEGRYQELVVDFLERLVQVAV